MGQSRFWFYFCWKIEWILILRVCLDLTQITSGLDALSDWLVIHFVVCLGWVKLLCILFFFPLTIESWKSALIMIRMKWRKALFHLLQFPISLQLYTMGVGWSSNVLLKYTYGLKFGVHANRFTACAILRLFLLESKYYLRPCNLCFHFCGYNQSYHLRLSVSLFFISSIWMNKFHTYCLLFLLFSSEVFHNYSHLE